MKLSLSLMCHNETKELEACFNSVEKYVDEKVVTFTGENPETLNILNKYNCKVIPCNFKTHPDYFFQKGDDRELTFSKPYFEVGKLKYFGAVRTLCLEHTSNPLVLWLDSDDTFEGAKHLPEFIKYFEKDKNLGWLWFMYDYDRDRFGNTSLCHIRSSIIRKGGAKWVGYVHEELVKTFDSHMVKIEPGVAFIKHHITKERNTNSGFRNLLISEYWYNKEKKANKLDPLNIWNYAKSLNAIEAFPEALEIFKEFVNATETDEHRYDGCLRMSEIARKLRMFDFALDCGMTANKLRPMWPWGYLSLADTAFCMNDWEKTIFWIKEGLSLGDPSDEIPLAFDPTALTWKPLQPLVYALMEKGRFKEAQAVNNKALQFIPKSKYFLGWKKQIDEAVLTEHIENNCLEIYKYLKDNKEDDKLKDFSKGLPRIVLDHPVFSRLSNSYKTSEGWENKIIIYCGSSYEMWNPESIKSGIGGSEEAVINMSKYLTKLGWNVEVYNNCSKDGNYDGVLWKGFWQYDKTQKAKVFIGWRRSEYLKLAHKDSFKCLWMHDTWETSYSAKDELELIDKIFVLSKWHKSCFNGHIPEDKFFITRNGILPGHFNEKIERDPLACVYASSPDRGLDILLQQWPKIVKEVPAARLHIFYGFTKNYEEVHKNDRRMLRFKQEIMDMIKKNKDTVTYYGRVGQEELAKYFLSCGLWLYPTYFTEISCITAMKCQAAGCIPIATTMAALDETVQYGVKVDDKVTREKTKRPGKADQITITVPDNMKDEWTKQTIHYLKNPKEQEKIRPEMMKWAKNHYAWANVANEWSNLFKGIK